MMLRKLASLAVAYPMLSPVILVYALTKDSRALDLLYSVRSVFHGFPFGRGLRCAEYEGGWILFPSREDPNFEDVFLRDVYYPYKPDGRDVVFDVGAHMGLFTVKIARHVEKVVAFEPDPFNFQFLLANIECNRLSNVVALNCALGERDCSMFLRAGYGHGRTRLTREDTGRKVRVRSVDSVVKELGLSPSVLKIDTEGYEVKVLEGAESTLDLCKPRLLVASYHYPNEAQDVAKYLVDRQYCGHAYYVPLTLQAARETYINAQARA